jgi:chemotaxis signal transduction protein
MDNLTEDTVSERPRLQVFTRGTARFAIPEYEIAVVAASRRPTPLPQAPPAVLGVVSIQGRMVTVLDPVALLEASSTQNGSQGLIVALRGDDQLALIVDEKGETLTGDLESEVEAANGVQLGVIEYQAETIPILNVKKLFALAIRGRGRRQRRF